MRRADRKDSQALFSAGDAGTMMAEKGTRGEAIPRIISLSPVRAARVRIALNYYPTRTTRGAPFGRI